MIFGDNRTNHSSTRTVSKFISVNMIIILLLLIVSHTLTGCIHTDDTTIAGTLNDYEIHYIPLANIGDAYQYWNTDWSRRSLELYDEIITLTRTYLKTQKYIFGENDCNDMAVDLWERLNDNGIISLIAVGNLMKSDETFLECNHAWLVVYNAEGSAMIIDAASAKLYIWEDVYSSPQLTQYWEGFVYEKPADLMVDFKERW